MIVRWANPVSLAPLSLRCHSALAPLLLRGHSALAPPLLRCRSAADPLLLRCRSAAYPLPLRPSLAPLFASEMNIPRVRVYSAARLAAAAQDGTEEALAESKKPSPLTLAHDIDVREALQGNPDDGTMWPRDAAFLRKFDLLAVATSDFALTFWDTTCYKMGDESVSPRFVSRAHTREAQSLMEWCPPKNLLFTSGRSACVYGWTVTPLPVPKAAITCKLSGHRDFVQNLVFLPDLMVLTSASMDGTIKMWDVERLRLKSTRGGMFGHKKGVRALCVARLVLQHVVRRGAGAVHVAAARGLAGVHALHVRLLEPGLPLEHLVRVAVVPLGPPPLLRALLGRVAQRHACLREALLGRARLTVAIHFEQRARVVEGRRRHGHDSGLRELAVALQRLRREVLRVRSARLFLPAHPLIHLQERIAGALLEEPVQQVGVRAHELEGALVAGIACGCGVRRRGPAVRRWSAAVLSGRSAQTATR